MNVKVPPHPVRPERLVGALVYPFPGLSIDVVVTFPEVLENDKVPLNPEPPPPVSVTLVTVVPFLLGQLPVTFQAATQEYPVSRVAVAVAPDPPPPIKETAGVVA